MPDFSPDVFAFPAPIGSISTWGPEASSYGAPMAGGDSLGNNNQNIGAIAAGGHGKLIEFILNRPVSVIGLGWWNGSTSSGNVDAGIYDINGNRIVSTGSTAQGTVSVMQTVSVSTTILLPGNYYLAVSQDNTTGTLKTFSMSLTPQEAIGVKEVAGFPLASTITLIAPPTTLGYPSVLAFIGPAF